MGGAAASVKAKGTIMKKKAFLIFLLLSVCANLLAQDKKLALKDFAGGIKLTGESGSLLSFKIPQEVYQGLERQDLKDIRVFDANGILVPFAVIVPPIIKEAIFEPNEKVPFFIWKPAGNQELPDTRNVEINVTGAVVSVKDYQAASSETPVFLVDLSALKKSANGLRIDFDHGGVFFNSTVTVQASSDLNTWQPFNKPQTVAYYNNIDSDRTWFDIPENSRYVLFKFNQKVPPVSGVAAQFPVTLIEMPLEETVITGEKSDDGEVIYYDTKGYFPLRAIDFKLPQPDSIQVNIRNQSKYPDGPFNMQRLEHIFKIVSGTETRTNLSIQISERNGITGRHWTLLAAGEATFASVPELTLYWEPLILVFLSRGEGPWTLAYGNESCGSTSENNLPLTAEDMTNTLGATATGESYYTPHEPEKEKHLSKWVLWGVLILAAGILTFLAFFVAKQLKNSI
jgi:hypothetical protein